MDIQLYMVIQGKLILTREKERSQFKNVSIQIRTFFRISKQIRNGIS